MPYLETLAANCWSHSRHLATPPACFVQLYVTFWGIHKMRLKTQQLPHKYEICEDNKVSTMR